LDGLISVIAALVILCLPLRKQRLGNENQLILILAGLLYVQYWNGFRIIVTSGSRAYLLNNPPVETANNKVTHTLFYNGLYSLFGLIVAYNLYIKKIPNLLDAIVPYSKSKTVNYVATLFIVLITITGVIASLGLGTAQVVNGINYAFKVDYGNNFLLLMVILIGVIATYSALTGINKVIKFLADFDFTFSIILMLFIALFLNFNTFMFQTFTAFTIISFIFLK
jgi:glycine betaine transporter